MNAQPIVLIGQAATPAEAFDQMQKRVHELQGQTITNEHKITHSQMTFGYTGIGQPVWAFTLVLQTGE